MASKRTTGVLKAGIIVGIIVLAVLAYLMLRPEPKVFSYHPVSSKDNPNVYPIEGKGPTGEHPTDIGSLVAAVQQLDAREVASHKHTIALAMHDLKNDWSKAVVEGFNDTLKFFGQDAQLITDGEFEIKKQMADLKNIAKIKPDVLVVLPVDSQVTARTLQKVLASGTKLIFIDSVAKGFVFPHHYKGWVVGDSFVLGSASADLLARKLDKKGKVALLLWKNKMFTVDQRVVGAKASLKKYPDIEVVEEVYFEEFYQIKGLMQKLLEKHPDLDGLWAVWDTPALEAIKTIRDRKAKVKVTCVDMSRDVAREFTDSDILVGTAVDHPYDAGVAAALLAIAAIEDLRLQDYYVHPAEIVTPETFRETWKRIYKRPYTRKK